jgi:hypothetical protein
MALSKVRKLKTQAFALRKLKTQAFALRKLKTQAFALQVVLKREESSSVIRRDQQA